MYVLKTASLLSNCSIDPLCMIELLWLLSKSLIHFLGMSDASFSQPFLYYIELLASHTIIWYSLPNGRGFLGTNVPRTCPSTCPWKHWFIKTGYLSRQEDTYEFIHIPIPFREQWMNLPKPFFKDWSLHVCVSQCMWDVFKSSLCIHSWRWKFGPSNLLGLFSSNRLEYYILFLLMISRKGDQKP